MIRTPFFYFNPLLYCHRKYYLTTNALSKVHFSILNHLPKPSVTVKHAQYWTKSLLLHYLICNSLGVKHLYSIHTTEWWDSKSTKARFWLSHVALQTVSHVCSTGDFLWLIAGLGFLQRYPQAQLLAATCWSKCLYPAIALALPCPQWASLHQDSHWKKHCRNTEIQLFSCFRVPTYPPHIWAVSHIRISKRMTQ